MKRRANIPAKADVDCRKCGTTHLGVRLVLDEDDGGCYEIDTRQCNADYCHERLCTDCLQFECADCGLAFCASHEIEYSGLSLCRECMKLRAEEWYR